MCFTTYVKLQECPLLAGLTGKSVETIINHSGKDSFIRRQKRNICLLPILRLSSSIFSSSCLS